MPSRWEPSGRGWGARGLKGGGIVALGTRMAVHRGDQRGGQGETGRDLSRLGDIASTGTFAVCPTSPAHRVRDNGTAAKLSGRLRISGDHIPERWAELSRNDLGVFPKAEPRLVRRTGAPHVALGGWG